MSRGADWASMDGNHPVNGLTYKQENSFAIIRKSFVEWDGSKWVSAIDPTYGRDTPNLRAAGVKVCAYMYPGLMKNGPSFDEQLDVFEDPKDGEIVKGVDFVPAFDVEFMGGGYQTTGLSQPELVDELDRFIEAWEDRFGVPGLLYLSHGIFHDRDTGLGNPTRPKWGRWKLWQKTAYVRPAGQPVYTGSINPPHIGPASWDPDDYYRIPDPWVSKGAWMQQPQGDAKGITGISNQADLDIFLTISRANAHGDPRVKEIQQIVGATVDGDWGDETDRLVAEYQTKHGQKPDSVIGPATWAPMSWETLDQDL